MRNASRFLAAVALAAASLAFVPAPASAFQEGLDVEPDTANRLVAAGPCAPVATDACAHDLTVTWDPATGTGEDATVAFEILSGPSDTDGNADMVPVDARDVECTIDAEEKCTVSWSSTTAGKDDVIAWVETDMLPGRLEADNSEPVGQDASDMDSTDRFEVSWLTGVLNLDPEAPEQAPGTPQAITAELKSVPATGSTDPAVPLVGNIDVEIIAGPGQNSNSAGPDLTCDTAPETGQCELTVNSTVAGKTGIRGWVDLNEDDQVPGEADGTEGRDETTQAGTPTEPDLTDLVEINWVAGATAPRIDVEPENAQQTVGQEITFTVTSTSATGPQGTVNVAAQVAPGGANSGKTARCLTSAAGSCTLSYTGTNPGTDTLVVAVDANGNGLPNEADAGEAVATPGTKAEPDETDVVQVVWNAAKTAKAKCKNVKGSSKDEKLRGKGGCDKITGKGGDDVLTGRGGDDILSGGPGKDVCAGGPGDDKYRGCEKIKGKGEKK